MQHQGTTAPTRRQGGNTFVETGPALPLVLQHGGRDRHICLGVPDIQPLVKKLEEAGIKYTKSMSGRPAVFFRDPGE